MSVMTTSRGSPGSAIAAASLCDLLIQSETRTIEALWSGLRRQLTDGIACPGPVHFSAITAVIWVAFYNSTFWQLTGTAMWHGGTGSILFMATLAVLLVVMQTTLLLMLVTARAMKMAVSALFVVAALSSYFCGAYGVIFNQDMMRNVFQTDAAEVGGLMTAAMLWHLFALGIVPAILVQRVKFPVQDWKRQLRARGGFLAVAWLAVIAGLFSTPADYAVFLRQHKPLRYTIVPAAPLISSIGLLSASVRDTRTGPLLNPGGSVRHVGTSHTRPLVLLLVVGETARAADFELGGYQRETNPHLESVDGLTYFDHATSCGTATAISVPCMFSPLRRRDFDVDNAGRYVNLLDTLVAAGFDVQWWDNNAGCKGVCARIKTVEYAQRRNAQSCPHSYCFDAVMLDDLARELDGVQHDTVIVFHQIGSHGPAYAERYPPQFEIFKPACRTSELSQCTIDEVRNAYDNTIAYTDYVLSRQIALLNAASDRADTMLIYASDHGESLGERGIYLHGMPYAFAPDEQKQVPLLIWTSAAFRARQRLDQNCFQKNAHAPVSHDNLYDTVLGAAGLRNDVYNRKADLLADCEPAGSAQVAAQ